MKTRSQRDMYLEPMHNLLMKRILDLATGFVKEAEIKVENIIDVGSAEGMYLNLLPPSEIKIGIDISPTKIRVGKKEQKNVMFVICDAQSMPIRSGAFDIALCVEVLEHVKNPERVVDEIHRILKPGGQSIISVPLGDTKDPTHIQVFVPSKLRKLLNRYGFVTEEESPNERIKVNLRILLREHVKKFIPDFIKEVLPRFFPDTTSKIYFPFIVMPCRKCLVER